MDESVVSNVGNIGNVGNEVTGQEDKSRYFHGKKLSPAQRWTSLAEVAVGAAIVIGHNVYHVVPNEVPILFVLGILSFRLREGSFAALGLAWPESWLRTIVFAAITAVIVLAVGQLVTEPLAKYLGLHENAGAAGNALGTLAGHPWTAARGLFLVWTFA